MLLFYTGSFLKRSMDYNNDKIKYWLAFSRIDEIGAAFITKVWSHFGCIKEAWFASSADLCQIEGLNFKKIEEFLEVKKNVIPEALLENIVKKEIKIITREDVDYPFLLSQIHSAPQVLYMKGSLDTCNLDRALAVVGSRKASHYAIEILNKLISDLRGSGITIVSGMALGVDACAHWAAINNNLPTIAVLGSGFDKLYPKQNVDLFNKIIDGHGAVLTEFYPEAEPISWRFPMRNRIVSGLCKGTLVAEAGLKSGALITARLTLEQNRDLLCLPGLVTNPNTHGTHQLIKEGAALVTNSEDILSELGWHATPDIAKENKKNFQPNVVDNEKILYDILTLEPLSIDEILNQTNLNIGDLMITLTTLELKGLIKQIAGEKYIKTLR